MPKKNSKGNKNLIKFYQDKVQKFMPKILELVDSIRPGTGNQLRQGQNGVIRTMSPFLSPSQRSTVRKFRPF